MNKKLATSLGIAAVALSLAACGNSNHQASQQSSSTTASVKPVHHAVHYNNDEYALMAYLRATNQSVGSMKEAAANTNWQKADGSYQFANDNQQVTVEVQSSKVTVTANDQQSTYSKSTLAKKFTDKKALDNILSNLNRQDDGNGQSTNTNSNGGTTGQQQPNQAAGQSTDSDGHVTIAGHSFHHANFHGNDILVGDNKEGEAGEFLANDPDLNQDQRDAALNVATSQEHPNPN